MINPLGVSTSNTSKEEHRLIFETFCCERYVDKSRRTSKTVSEEKAKRIRQAVKGEQTDVFNCFFLLNSLRMTTHKPGYLSSV